MVTRQDFVNSILKNKKINIADKSTAFAPANIALCKYWGKRDRELNLPLTDSLSISMGNLGTSTTISLSGTELDRVILNGRILENNSDFATKILSFVKLWKNSFSELCPPLEINTVNNIPTASGVASSASGFAALTKALDHFFGCNLSHRELSLLAGLGSGSASRSIFTGFVYRHSGKNDNGLDAYSEALPYIWPEFRLGLLTVSDAKKKISSEKGMNHTSETSVLFTAWKQQVEQDMKLICKALEIRDFDLLGKTSENNALSMHACMISANPPLIYWEPETLEIIKKVQLIRECGVSLYLTIDAGPNVKLIFQEKDLQTVKKEFPQVQIINPFP